MAKGTEITIKELCRSIIETQTEVRIIGENQILGRRHFTRLVFLILTAIVSDIVIHFILWSLK